MVRCRQCFFILDKLGRIEVQLQREKNMSLLHEKKFNAQTVDFSAVVEKDNVLLQTPAINKYSGLCGKHDRKQRCLVASK